jgi:hypothetical protein
LKYLLYNLYFNGEIKMENMRKIVICITAGTGRDNWEFYTVDPKVQRSVLAEFAESAAIEWAEAYGIGNPGSYPDPQDYDSDDEYADAVEQWEAEDHDWSQVDGWVEEYVSEKHDGNTTTGVPVFQELHC